LLSAEDTQRKWHSLVVDPPESRICTAQKRPNYLRVGHTGSARTARGSISRRAIASNQPGQYASVLKVPCLRQYFEILSWNNQSVVGVATDKRLVRYGDVH
jgi:hypothetical protein